MRLYMMLAFLSPLGITDLANKIKIYTNLKNLFNFEIYIILFLLKVISKYVIIFVNITWINIFIIARRKKWYKYACFPIWLADDYFQQYKVFHVSFIIYILFPFLICYTRLLMRWNVRPKKLTFLVYKY